MSAKVGSASSYERLLRTAKQLFAVRGYENTSTNMIARSAGTSESQLVKHFGSKRGLLEAIFERGWESLDTCLVSLEQCVPPVEKLRSIAQLTMSALGRDPELRDLFLLEGRRISNQGEKIQLSRGFQNYVHRIDQCLIEMHASGQLRPDLRPEAVRSGVMGMCEGLMRDLLVAQRMGTTPDYTEDDIRSLLDTILPALMSSSGSHKHNQSAAQ
jgi:AcrR family transcriptional regulator